MKKILSVFILFLIVMMPIAVNAASSGVCGTNQYATWELDDNGVFTVKGEGKIPDFTLSNLPWAELRDEIKNVVIEKGITYIGGTSFYQCTNLKSVTMPEGVTAIGTSAFSGCTSLGNITFPQSLESIGKSAFYNCTSMTRLDIPENISVMGNWAFNSCINVSEINWQAVNAFDLTESERAFPNLGNNTSGVKVTFANGVKRVPAYAFYGNPNITQIVLSDTVESIGIYAFDLTGFYKDSTNWEDDVLYVGKYLVKAKSTLSGEYTVKDGTRRISEKAFSSCSLLTGVTVPKSVEIIENQAFYNCTGLQNITLPFVGKSRESEETAFRYIFGEEIPSGISSVTVTDAKEICDFAFYNCPSVKSITVDGEVQRIGAYAFAECSLLQNIIVPDSVISIGEQAFLGTSFYENSANWENDALCLDKILIKVKDTISGEFSVKENIKYIADDAFNNCINLKDVKICESVTHIGNYAFYNCDSLETITIPKSVTSIGDFAFSKCDKLNSVIITESDIFIGNFAFADCTALKALPENITDIGESVFSYCNSLKDVTVKNDTTYRMYYGCDNLKYVKINSGVATVAPYTFGECVGIETLIIPKSVTKIETGAFENCYSIRTIKYEGSKEDWAQLKIAIKNEILLNAKVVYNSPIPERIVYLDVNVSDGIFTVTPTGVTVGEEIIFACYKGNQLSYVENVTYEGTNVKFTLDTEYNKVKVFVWKNINSMIPVIDTKDV